MLDSLAALPSAGAVHWHVRRERWIATAAQCHGQDKQCGQTMYSTIAWIILNYMSQNLVKGKA